MDPIVRHHQRCSRIALKVVPGLLRVSIGALGDTMFEAETMVFRLNASLLGAKSDVIRKALQEFVQQAEQAQQRARAQGDFPDHGESMGVRAQPGERGNPGTDSSPRARTRVYR